MVAIYLVSQSKGYPDEKFLRNIYTGQVDESNKMAQKSFGPMIKSNAKVEITSFDLKKCTKDDIKITCLVKVIVKTPRVEKQEKNIEFYLKPDGDSFTFSGKKYL